jgi:hypothetical protein
MVVFARIIPPKLGSVYDLGHALKGYPLDRRRQRAILGDAGRPGMGLYRETERRFSIWVGAAFPVLV